MLSEKVKELISKSRIVSFKDWQNYPPEAIAIFQQADDAGQYLTDQEIAKIKDLVPDLSESLEQGRLLRDNVSDIVSQARAVVLDANPGITEPGGGLYPPLRAEACWRDFWHFLRCISYGISGQCVNYTSDRGLAYMEQLYQELEVPLDAMVMGLEQLKVFSLREFEREGRSGLPTMSKQDLPLRPSATRASSLNRAVESGKQNDLEPYFDRLTESMRKFSPVG